MYLYLRAGWAGLFYWVKDNLNLAGILQENKDLDKFCSCKAEKPDDLVNFGQNGVEHQELHK